MPGDGIPIGQWSGSDATDQLRLAIVELHTATEKQTRSLLLLTWALAIMTGVMLIGVGIQIYLAL